MEKKFYMKLDYLQYDKAVTEIHKMLRILCGNEPVTRSYSTKNVEAHKMRMLQKTGSKQNHDKCWETHAVTTISFFFFICSPNSSKRNHCNRVFAKTKFLCRVCLSAINKFFCRNRQGNVSTYVLLHYHFFSMLK